MPDVGAAVSAAVDGMPEKLDLWSIVYALLIILCAVVVSRVLLRIVGKALEKGKLDPALRKIVRTLVRFVVGVVCILLICETLGIEITSLIALFSVVGLALSLAVQGVLANLAGGMIMLWAKPFQVGDFVEVDGVTGTVKEITLMYTKIDTTDNKLVSIPNKIVSESKSQNFSAEPTRRVELTFSASYDSPIDKVKKAVLDALAENALTLPAPAPVVGVAAFGASAIEYNVWVWCKAADYWPTLYSVNETVKGALDENGLEMTYDHINVHMIDQGR